MVASRDACPICDKPFYGKQKFVRCDTCELRFHCTCLHHGELDQATASATGKSVFTCDSCSNSLGPGNDKTPVESLQLQHPSSEGALSCSSSHSEYVSSVSSQLEAVRVNGQGTIELIQTLLDMVTKLTNEVTHLRTDNVYMKKEIKNSPWPAGGHPKGLPSAYF
jgi:hypothetical protein